MAKIAIHDIKITPIIRFMASNFNPSLLLSSICFKSSCLKITNYFILQNPSNMQTNRKIFNTLHNYKFQMSKYFLRNCRLKTKKN